MCTIIGVSRKRKGVGVASSPWLPFSTSRLIVIIVMPSTKIYTVPWYSTVQYSYRGLDRRTVGRGGVILYIY
jgi:hypothetical protein